MNGKKYISSQSCKKKVHIQQSFSTILQDFQKYSMLYSQNHLIQYITRYGRYQEQRRMMIVHCMVSRSCIYRSFLHCSLCCQDFKIFLSYDVSNRMNYRGCSGWHMLRLNRSVNTSSIVLVDLVIHLHQHQTHVLAKMHSPFILCVIRRKHAHFNFILYISRSVQ